MSRAIEALRTIKKRVDPEGIVVGSALAPASIPVVIPLAAGVTYAIHEIGRDIDPNLLKAAAIIGITLANILSAGIEARALKKRKYCASLIPNGINVLTGKPFLAAAAGHVATLAGTLPLNPINYAAIINGDSRLLTESIVATSTAVTLWRTTMNTLISQGKIQPVVDVAKTTRHAITDKARKVGRSTGQIFKDYEYLIASQILIPENL